MRILIVEDDALMIHALTSVLTNQNYAVEVVTDGQAAWDLIEAFEYDLVLLDVILPKLDGISLCQQIRSHGYSMPILLLTRRDSSHDKAIGLDAGADDYVVKPFEEEELVARIRALLRRGSKASQPILEWDDLRLDPSSCEVTYANKLLALTPKEYGLLELFLRNSRRVFSCGMILEHLWTYQDMPGEEAVRTHIKGLRQKLRAAGAADFIETVYGIGYRLKPLEEARERSTPIQSDQTTMLVKIAAVWQHFQGQVSQQVSVIEAAIEALSQGSVDTELLAAAQQEAHSLAGSLGTFGLPEGSRLAAYIETALRKNAIDAKPDLQQWVRRLRQEVSQSLTPLENAELASALPTTQIQRSSQTDKILLVDDDPKILALLQTLLQPWGLQVSTIADPRQFWQTLEAVSPDLLVLDVEMPYLNGIELCKVIRNDPHWSELPIVFLTVHKDAEVVNQVFTVGADDFVSKPIVGPELVTRIVNRLERNKRLHRVAKAAESQLNEALAKIQQLQATIQALQTSQV
ncbi:MAG: response regulator [Candidatus Parcubacteria bacterium]|uniref:response regulator n=1 Tax=Phormidesmis priestleyi TaxID=268141 RepID=UPI00083B26CA|nr:response regulator [Phormidesmis priestleyi]MBC7825906.1 response regulator [Leptolyngbyaceae cyanobacterium LF-bin-113]